MADPINIPPITGKVAGLKPPAPPAPPAPAGRPDGQSFQDMLADTVGEVQRLQNEADNTIRKLVAGEITDVAEAMVAIERADVSFQTMMAVRNRIVAAYEEVLRMQI